MTDSRVPARARTAVLAAALLAALPLGGCVVAAVGAAGTAGYVAAQDRTTGTVVDDATIRTKIGARLFDKSEKLYGDVSTEVVQGKVLMTGNVPRPEDKIEASRLAWTVDGVKEVRNEIAVTDQGGVWNYTKDTWITTQVKTAILADTSIRSLNYTVETNNQVVYLTGVAQNQQELDLAINHARNVSGVTKVVPYVTLLNRRAEAPAPSPPPPPVEPNSAGSTSPSGMDAPQPLSSAPSSSKIETQPLN